MADRADVERRADFPHRAGPPAARSGKRRPRPQPGRRDHGRAGRRGAVQDSDRPCNGRGSAGHHSGRPLGSPAAAGVDRAVAGARARTPAERDRRGAGRLLAGARRPRAGRQDGGARPRDYGGAPRRASSRPQPGRRAGTAGNRVQRHAGTAGSVVRSDAALHGQCLARAADAADGHPERWRGWPARAAGRGRIPGRDRQHARGCQPPGQPGRPAVDPVPGRHRRGDGGVGAGRSRRPRRARRRRPRRARGGEGSVAERGADRTGALCR